MLGSFHVYKRPHLNEFLQFAANEFDVGVWTSAGAEYANGIVEAIFTNAAPLFLYSSEHCTLCRDLSTGKYVAMKRLSKLKSKGYKLDHIIAVDDSPEKHKDN
jgi:RNA polymerase II subunit A small phosphatase-like protein